MIHFNIRRRGSRLPILILAPTRTMASMKLKMLIRGRNLLMFPDLRMMPNSLRKTRRIFKGK